MTKKAKNFANTVENAKVLVHTYKYYSIGASGYIHEGDGLVHVTVTGNIFDFKKCEVTTTFEDGKGNIYRRTGDDICLYQTKEAYECSDPMHMHSQSTMELLRYADYKHLLECQAKYIDDQENNVRYTYLVVWVFENGEAREVPCVIDIISYEKDNGWKLLNGSIPEKFWESQKDAYDFNEYTVIDSDGEEFIEQGKGKRLLPNKEQWQIIYQLRDLVKKAKEANLKFLFDRDYAGTIKVLNMENVDDMGYDIESEVGGTTIGFSEMPVIDTELDVFDYNGEESFYHIALNPTPRQRKEWLKAHPDNV